MDDATIIGLIAGIFGGQTLFFGAFWLHLHRRQDKLFDRITEVDHRAQERHEQLLALIMSIDRRLSRLEGRAGIFTTEADQPAPAPAPPIPAAVPATAAPVVPAPATATSAPAGEAAPAAPGPPPVPAPGEAAPIATTAVPPLAPAAGT